jgi:hypothetical protein
MMGRVRSLVLPRLGFKVPLLFGVLVAFLFPMMNSVHAQASDLDMMNASIRTAITQWGVYPVTIDSVTVQTVGVSLNVVNTGPTAIETVTGVLFLWDDFDQPLIGLRLATYRSINPGNDSVFQFSWDLDPTRHGALISHAQRGGRISYRFEPTGMILVDGRRLTAPLQ